MCPGLEASVRSEFIAVVDGGNEVEQSTLKYMYKSTSWETQRQCSSQEYGVPWRSMSSGVQLVGRVKSRMNASRSPTGEEPIWAMEWDVGAEASIFRLVGLFIYPRTQSGLAASHGTSLSPGR